MSHLIVERKGHVLVLTMNRPEARNALSLEMRCKMADAWAEGDSDPEIRCAVPTGAEGCFSSGADLKMMHGDQSANPYKKRFDEDPELHWRAMLRNARPTVPVIAAVEGYALAGGTEMLQGTDIRVAGESATFAVSEVRWGLFPLGGSTVRLRRQIPFAKAMDMLRTGRRMKADEAERIGLISRIVPDGTALEKALEIAERIAANGPLAVQGVRQSALESDCVPEAQALARELEIGWPVFKSKDAREGPKAFAEGRTPEFTGE